MNLYSQLSYDIVDTTHYYTGFNNKGGRAAHDEINDASAMGIYLDADTYPSGQTD